MHGYAFRLPADGCKSSTCGREPRKGEAWPTLIWAARVKAGHSSAVVRHVCVSACQEQPNTINRTISFSVPDMTNAMANQLVHCTEGAGRLCKVNGLIQFVFQKENSVSHEEDSLQGDEARDRVSPQSSVELSVACFKN